MENKLREKYIGIAKKHFEGKILPKFKEIFGDKYEDIIVYVSGSVSHGYCDKLSDIDIGILFFDGITATQEKQIDETREKVK